MKTVIVMIMPVLLLACSSNNKKKQQVILKEEKMQAVLWDVLRADAFAFQFIIKDSSKKPEAEIAKLQQQIFAVHKTNRESFYKSLDYYKQHPDIFQPMLDSMINRYTRDKYVSIQSSKPVVSNTDTSKHTGTAVKPAIAQ